MRLLLVFLNDLLDLLLDIVEGIETNVRNAVLDAVLLKPQSPTSE